MASMSNKRIALLCQHFYPEMISTGMHMTELATGLAREGVRLRVYCAYPAYKDVAQSDEVAAEMVYQDVEIVRLATWGDPRGNLLWRGLFAISFLLVTAIRVLRERKSLSGVIVTTNPPFIGLVATLLNWVAGLSYVTIVYDVYPDIAVQLEAFRPKSPIVWLWERITKTIFRYSKALIVIGRDMERIVRDKLAGGKMPRIDLIPNWSDERHIRPIPRTENPFAQQHYPDGHIVIQYSGRMGRTHNIEPLLYAADQLRDQPVLFQLIGEGAKRAKLEQIATDRQLTNVQFLPYQPIEILDTVLSAPDMAVVCLDERFTGLSVPSKTYGIMASGTPILAFIDPDSEIGLTVAENDCGIVLPDPTGDAIVAIVRDLIDNPDRFAQMGNNGYSAFCEKYTLSHSIDRYHSLLNDCFLTTGQPHVADQPKVTYVKDNRELAPIE